MRRLTAAGLLPERAGQPVKAWVHITLADLLRLEGSSALQEQWTAQVRARWAARRAAASETGASDGAWLDGDAAEAIACDAAMAPDRHRRRQRRTRWRTWSGCAWNWTGSARRRPGHAGPDTTRPGPRWSRPSSARPWTCCPAPAGSPRSCAAGSSASGWAGRACRWTSATPRRSRPGSATRCLLRDRHCQWAGGCTQPAGACEVHHTKHKADGGKTSVKDCVLLCTLPPPDRDPPLGLDPGRQPGRDDERVEQEQDQGAAQPRTTRPRRVSPGLPGASRVGDRLWLVRRCGL